MFYLSDVTVAVVYRQHSSTVIHSLTLSGHFLKQLIDSVFIKDVFSRNFNTVDTVISLLTY